jgi:ankyrin repeat protein
MLLEACQNGDLEAVVQLASHQDLEMKNPQGFTPLIVAAKEGHTEIVEHLVRSGSNLNASNHVIFTQ